MIRLAETSILEIPVLFLRSLFKDVREYYKEHGRYLDAYEHVWGTTYIEWASVFFGLFYKPALIVWVLCAFFHIVWKEIWMDRKKRVDLASWNTFKVDMITRVFGRVLTLPFFLFVLWRG